MTLFSILCLWGCEKNESGQYPDWPNLLLITLDTTRADYIGCYGSPDVQTPHMDRLASEGTRFLRHIAPSQCTNPAHATIMTGLYPARHGTYNNKTPLTDHAETLAEILQARGYATLAAVSARHLNDKNSNFGQGFGEYLDCNKRSISAHKRNGRFLNKLKGVSGRPFFAWIHYFDPHGDYRPPRRYARMYQPLDDYDPVPSSKRMESEVAKSHPMVDPDDIIPLYKGEITYMDSEIGRLLTLLDELGISDRTLVVLIADHGESMVEKGIYFCHAGMYNQVLHVPLIVRWPGRVPAGMSVNALTGSADILPTVLELLGVQNAPGDIDGRSLVPALANADTALHEAVFSESVDGRVRAVYDGEFKLIKTYNPGWATREDHLYRGFEDYGERHDLKHRMPDRMKQLAESLDDWLAAAAARALAHEAEGHGMDEKTEKALRALGYIE